MFVYKEKESMKRELNFCYFTEFVFRKKVKLLQDSDVERKVY